MFLLDSLTIQPIFFFVVLVFPNTPLVVTTACCEEHALGGNRDSNHRVPFLGAVQNGNWLCSTWCAVVPEPADRVKLLHPIASLL